MAVTKRKYSKEFPRKENQRYGMGEVQYEKEFKEKYGEFRQSLINHYGFNCHPTSDSFCIDGFDGRQFYSTGLKIEYDGKIPFNFVIEALVKKTGDENSLGELSDIERRLIAERFTPTEK